MKEFDAKEVFLMVQGKAGLAGEIALEYLRATAEPFVPIDTRAMRDNVEIKQIDASNVSIEYKTSYAKYQYNNNLKHKVENGKPSKIRDFAPPKTGKRRKRKASGGFSASRGTGRERYNRGYYFLRKNGGLEYLPENGKWLHRVSKDENVMRKFDRIYARALFEGLK